MESSRVCVGLSVVCGEFLGCNGGVGEQCKQIERSRVRNFTVAGGRTTQQGRRDLVVAGRRHAVFWRQKEQ